MPRWLVNTLLIATVAFACFRISLTYSEYTQTMDEPFHIACGMERLATGKYTIENQHPPLPRIVSALGPFLLGMRYEPGGTGFEAGTRMLQQGGNYWRYLTAARIGTLAWFILACFSLFAVAIRLFDPTVALAAVFLFTQLPAVLTHAGLATNDMAACACLIFVFACFLRYTADPRDRNAILLGAAFGLAFVTKFSLLLFLPVTLFPLILLLRPKHWPHLAIAGITAFAILWLTYGIQISPWRFGLKVPTAYYQIREGINQVRWHNDDGHDAVFLGKYYRYGFTWYFPTLFLFKTPIAFLTLGIAGYATFLSRWRQTSIPVRSVFLATPLIFLACLPSHITIGLRHVLPLYPMFAMAAAYALTTTQFPKRTVNALVLLLALTGTMESATAFRDPLPYFNALAPQPHAEITVDSDIDWGQGLKQLAAWYKREKIDSTAFYYFGNAPLNVVDLPKNLFHLPVDRPVPGYVAISAYGRVLHCLKNNYFCWLRGFEPDHTMPNGIAIYYIPKGPLR
jgi:4-amino-4-deoxy-L-arabinose transferase-like glycosyltransferase